MNKPIAPSDFDGPRVTTGPLPASRKVYSHPAAAPDLAVPHRQIDLHPTANEPPVPVYDTSGPYTDPDAAIDVATGLAPIRRPCALERGDVEEYDGREVRPQDDGYASFEPASRACAPTGSWSAPGPMETSRNMKAGPSNPKTMAMSARLISPGNSPTDINP